LSLHLQTKIVFDPIIRSPKFREIDCSCTIPNRDNPYIELLASLAKSKALSSISHVSATVSNRIWHSFVLSIPWQSVPNSVKMECFQSQAVLSDS
jgi:hypothetical protein